MSTKKEIEEENKTLKEEFEKLRMTAVNLDGALKEEMKRSAAQKLQIEFLVAYANNVLGATNNLQNQLNQLAQAGVDTGNEEEK
jgi:predicted transcriptional regulator|tara:strand:- start:3190 stop:3441 length:252 start_codon:yes stop_codon:yes gene_type:complete